MPLTIHSLSLTKPPFSYLFRYDNDINPWQELALDVNYVAAANADAATTSSGSGGDTTLISGGDRLMHVRASASVIENPNDYQGIDSTQSALLQAAILKIFYEATGGPNWRNKDNWDRMTGTEDNSVICSAYGVTCDGNDNISKLELRKYIKVNVNGNGQCLMVENHDIISSNRSLFLCWSRFY
jgi:hypothetical protein